MAFLIEQNVKRLPDSGILKERLSVIELDQKNFSTGFCVEMLGIFFLKIQQIIFTALKSRYTVLTRLDKLHQLALDLNRLEDHFSKITPSASQ